MATSKEYLRFVLDRLSDLEGISYKQMMGEYIIYYKGKIAAYVCDNRVLIKPVKSALSLMPEAPLQAPYEGAKEMLLAENIDDKGFMTELFRAIYDDLPEPKPKKKQ
ncbi:MAG: TfoX/Sxy family protein [Eubacteriales bacterium]